MALLGAPPARRLSAHAQGLGFNLSEDQKAFQIAARDFAREVIIPQAADLDRTMKFPHDVFDKAWEMGLANCHIPEEYGGLVSVCVRVVVCEQPTITLPKGFNSYMSETGSPRLPRCVIVGV